MFDKTKAKLQEAERLKKEGKTLKEICKTLHLSSAVYYKYRGQIKAKSKKQAKHKFVDIPLHSAEIAASDRIAVIVCTQNNLKQILEGLK